jgi:FlaG/FlaF family flagellin (archaellin)
MGQGESKSTATWSADGKSLTVVTKATFNDTERTTTAVWSLTDANTLSIASTRQGQDGTPVKTTMVYDKK